MGALTALHFDNTYARLPEAFYARLAPTPVPDPYLVSVNAAAAALIDVDIEEAQAPESVAYWSGNRLLPGAEPLAMLYAGHQFGHYTPQLGDGRALLLGEVRNRAGEKWDLHLKGAGPTPYSRGFDGRAVLRSTIREYLCSEAMHALGIPSSRALTIVGSEMAVYRETAETSAILLRLAPSHVRFGSFEIFYYRNQHTYLQQLADYVIAHHFPHLHDAKEKYPRFLTEVVARTARLMAMWQAVGFAHGVLNTDNMSILGITLDYGPFGFLDAYEAGFVCNHSDTWGRYAFDQQPAMGFWNLQCLAQTLLPLMTKEEAVAALETYQPALAMHYGACMRAKLGLQTCQPRDGELIADLLELMQKNHLDYSYFFRALGHFSLISSDRNARLRDMCLDRDAFDAWACRYRDRLQAEQSGDTERKKRMDRTNPKYILRNYLAQQAIVGATEQQDFSEIERLLAVLRHPYDDQAAYEPYAALPPDWGKGIEVSCSS